MNADRRGGRSGGRSRRDAAGRSGGRRTDRSADRSTDRSAEQRGDGRGGARGETRSEVRGPASDAARSEGRHGTRIVVGIHPVRELLRAARPVQSILIARGRTATPALEELDALARAAGVPVRRVEPKDLDAAAPGLVHQGVVATAPTFPLVDLARLLAHVDASGRPALLVAVDGVTDPHNLGSIARSAEAVGAHGLIVPDRRSAPVTAIVEKSAAGALAHLPVARVTNLARALEELGRHGIWSIGLDGAATTPLAGHPLAAGPVVLVIGAEGAGLSRLIGQRCDAVVRLPMRGRVGSLNASVAAGVALYTLLAAREGGVGPQ